MLNHMDRFWFSGVLLLALAYLVPPIIGQEVAPIRQTGQDATGSAGPKNDGNFKLVRMANGVAADGALFSENTYERLTGEKVWVIMIHYGSAERVKTQFEEKVAKATKVIEQQKVAGEKGATEARAIITFTANNKKVVSMIIVTAGTELREIQSYSLQDALEYEKQIKH